MKHNTNNPTWYRLPALAAALLILLVAGPLKAATGDETFTPLRNLAAIEQGDADACLRASPIDDTLHLGPCPSGKADDPLAEWAARSGPLGVMLVNAYQTPGNPQRCLFNVGWQAKMAACDASRSESHWTGRDLVPGYGRLQNAYPTEQRCLLNDHSAISLASCQAQAQNAERWSTDGMPRDPEYRQANPEAFPQPRALRITSLPSATHERDRLKQNMLWSDWQPLGFHLNAYTGLEVTVTGDPQGAVLEMVVGTPSLVLPWRHNEAEQAFITQKLHPGKNTVISPKNGLLSVRFVKDTSPASAVELTLGPQAEPIPFYQLGTTNDAQWQHMLQASTIPLAQLVSDKVVLVGTLESVRKANENYPWALLDIYQQGIDAQNRSAGLNACTPPNDPSSLRPLVVETRQGANPFASNYIAGLPYPADYAFNAENVRGKWSIWHELGHQRQSPIWTWNPGVLGEVTVNVYTLAALRHWFGDDFPVPLGGPTSAYWDKVVVYLAAADEDRDFENLEKVGSDITGSMFEQMRRAFGDGFYPKLEQAIRQYADPISPGPRKQLFQVEASGAANADLSDYFIRWGLRPDEQTLAAIKALGLNKPEVDPTTVPVFKGSNKDRLLRLWAFRLPNDKVHVDGYATPVGAHIQVHSRDDQWPEIAGVDPHLYFSNDHLDEYYLADGQQQLEARVKGTTDTLELTVVDRPAVMEISAIRKPDNQIWV
ncbi:hypothetical protein F3J44_11235 [Pantoea sp. Tr-811]|uniref:M60 family metallopeptidase n=1 Tax=Pantoea sp. Tr-811 TaxID=2608361 RepID=UPI0014225CCC|nr:M60 family metallopeptidase [Pantoea sp. Tr-811]NIF26947.1 hypothetical protein [Pantoea sp. Tr-811]